MGDDGLALREAQVEAMRASAMTSAVALGRIEETVVGSRADINRLFETCRDRTDPQTLPFATLLPKPTTTAGDARAFSMHRTPMTGMALSRAGLIEIAEHEGIVLAPYRDSTGIWT